MTDLVWAEQTAEALADRLAEDFEVWEPMQPFLHYVVMTPVGRPFLSRQLCDLSGQDGRPFTSAGGGADWSRVDCPRCLAAGAETEAAVLGLPDAALIALGAWHEGMTERP